MRFVHEPGREWPFDLLPPRTIALDGASPGLRLEPETKRYSFDHHHGCVRLATAATCRQVYDALLLGFEPAGFDVLVNDLDGDTIVACWLLRHWDRWRDERARARVLPLLEAVACADAHGPAYPLQDVALLASFRQRVLQAGRQAASAGGRELDAVLDRMEDWWQAGLPACDPVGEPAVSARTTCVTDHGTWAHAMTTGGGEPTEHGADVAWLLRDGWLRIVATRPMDGARWKHVLARRSDFVSGFPIARLVESLNEREAQARGTALGPGQTWGGGSTIAGSPRDGSVLGPMDVEVVVMACL